MSIYLPVQLQDSSQLARFCATSEELPGLNLETTSQPQADARWMLADDHGQIVARCSLWWRATPAYGRHRLGLIGHYAAREAGAAAQLLRLACDQLAAQGCTMAVGPMDGHTWQRYRLITERGSQPTSFMEPDNPDDWPAHFIDNGFQVLARYLSTINPSLDRLDPRLTKVAERAANRGIRIRPLKPDGFAEALPHIYRIAVTSFRDNFLYTPISEAEFIALYQPVQAYIQPELILIAEREGQPIGFIFALPDLLQAQTRPEMLPELDEGPSRRNGPIIDTVILKTVAVHPDHQVRGLGSLLVARCQEVAYNLGYRRAVHALMHEKNGSRKISRRNQTQIIRRYALFGREL